MHKKTLTWHWYLSTGTTSVTSGTQIFTAASTVHPHLVWALQIVLTTLLQPEPTWM